MVCDPCVQLLGKNCWHWCHCSINTSMVWDTSIGKFFAILCPLWQWWRSLSAPRRFEVSACGRNWMQSFDWLLIQIFFRKLWITCSLLKSEYIVIDGFICALWIVFDVFVSCFLVFESRKNCFFSLTPNFNVKVLVQKPMLNNVAQAEGNYVDSLMLIHPVQLNVRHKLHPPLNDWCGTIILVIECFLVLLGWNNLGEALNYFGVLWAVHFVVLLIVVVGVLLG